MLSIVFTQNFCRENEREYDHGVIDCELPLPVLCCSEFSLLWGLGLVQLWNPKDQLCHLEQVTYPLWPLSLKCRQPLSHSAIVRIPREKVLV